MKRITLAIISILLAGSLFAKKPAPPPPDTQTGWHVSIFEAAQAKSPNLYSVGDDTCVVNPNSVRCGVLLSHRVFLLSNGHIIDTSVSMPSEVNEYILRNAGLSEVSSYTFSYHLERFTAQDILGRPITKQHFTLYMHGMNPPPKDYRVIYSGIDSMFKGGITVTIADWQQASHDLIMSDIVADIFSCDVWHQKYGTACTDEAAVKILRQFIDQTPALSLVDSAFARHDQYLGQFIH